MRLGLLMIVLIVPAFAIGDDAKPSANLLRNASIEEGDANPKDWDKGNSIAGVEYSWEKAEGSQGKACLCIKKTASRYFPIACWSQTIERTGDSPVLQVSAQVKAKDATKAILDVLFLDARDEWISHKWAAYVGSKKPGDPPANHDWKQYSGWVEIPPNTKKIVIGLQDYGPGTVWFDEVSASYAKEPPRKPNESPTN